MNCCIFFCFLFTIGSAQLTEEECRQKKENLKQNGFLAPNSTVPCPENPCVQTTTPLNSSEPCPLDYCAIRDSKCFSKALPFSVSTNPLTSIVQTAQATFTKENISPRNLRLPANLPQFYPPALFPPNLPGAPLPDFMTPDLFSGILGGYGCQRGDFPFNCGLNPFDVTSNAPLLEPPLSIPYCLRIPCRSSNPDLETDPLGCYSKPGCYFDQELADLRRSFAFPILPGVAVCHLAIRNSNFQRLAHDYTSKNNQPWNVLYTHCLIEQNVPGITTPDPGCYALKFLKAVNIFPKIAGWKGITRRECYLLNACWEPSLEQSSDYNCFYPSETNTVRIRAGEDPAEAFNFNQRAQYGQPKCRPFLTDTPQNYLRSYYQCKQAGCVTDQTVSREALYHQYFKLTISPAVNSSIRPYFWQGLTSGVITASNYEEEISRLSQSPLYGFINYRRNTLVHPFNFQILAQYIQNVTEKNLDLGSSFLCNSPQPISPGIPQFGPQLPQGIPQFGPQLPQGIPQFGPQLSQGIPQFGPQLPQGIPQFGPQLPQGIPQFGPQLPQGIPQVGPQLPQTIPQVIPFPSTSGSIISNPFFIGNPLVPYVCPPTYSIYDPCPYQQLYVSGYPLLRGSFQGCCERNMCYIPRSQLSRQRSGPAAFYGEYSDFGECSVSCGGGVRKRERKCEKPYFLDTATCDGISEQSQNCNEQPCPHWSAWTKYGECSATCGRRTQTRRRRCMNGNNMLPKGGCIGKNRESRPCSFKRCAVFDTWGDFSPCCCGKGIQTRERQCVRNCDSPTQNESEQRPCETFCGRQNVRRRGRCNTRKCEQMVFYRCSLTKPGRTPCDKPAHCENFQPRRIETCFNGRCGPCRRLLRPTPNSCRRHLQNQG